MNRKKIVRTELIKHTRDCNYIKGHLVACERGMPNCLEFHAKGESLENLRAIRIV